MHSYKSKSFLLLRIKQGPTTGLPTRFCNAWKLTPQTKQTEADPTKRKFSNIPANPSANEATVIFPHGIFRFAKRFRDERFSSQFFLLSLNLKWKPKMLQKSPRFCIGRGGRYDRYIHPMNRHDVIVVNLWKNKLLFDPYRIISMSIEGLL